MIEDLDFAMPDGDPQTPETETKAEATPTPPPLVVVQYRQRGTLGRLTPPLLILIVALGVTYYQRGKANRVMDQAKAASVAPRTGSPRIDPKPTPEPSDPKTTTADASTEPPAAKAPMPERVEAKAPPSPTPPPILLSPFDITPNDGLSPLPGPVPPVAIADLGPISSVTAPAVIPANNEPTPAKNEEPAGPIGEEASREEILADIKREANANQAEQAELAEMKPKAQQMLLAEALDQVHAARSPFRKELKDVLEHFKGQAGPEIERLCQQFGRTAPKEAEELFHRGRRMLSVRLSRRDEVEFMRSCGLPETVILDFLSHKIHQTMNTRGGPRDANEVRIWAAKLLLSYTPGGASAPGAAVSSVR
ncbi:MAG: hypothetical protein AB7I30_12490 [Isosphaeraceae bacterium]